MAGHIFHPTGFLSSCFSFAAVGTCLGYYELCLSLLASDGTPPQCSSVSKLRLCYISQTVQVRVLNNNHCVIEEEARELVLLGLNLESSDLISTIVFIDFQRKVHSIFD